MPLKRKAKSSPFSFNKRYKRGVTYRYGKTLWSQRQARKAPYRIINNKVAALYRMIETKESLQQIAAVNTAIAHNNLIVPINPLVIAQGTGDPMAGTASRIGDRVTVKGVLIRGMFENAFERAKVFYRVLVTRSAKGDQINRDTLFKGDSPNKMIDQVNTDRFTILASQTFSISASNNTASSASAAGVPLSGTAAGIGTRLFKMWIPGIKFGKGGNVQFEDGSAAQPKFFDYRVVVMAYDWYGTPADINNVGRINHLYSKIYFKDA